MLLWGKRCVSVGEERYERKIRHSQNKLPTGLSLPSPVPIPPPNPVPVFVMSGVGNGSGDGLGRGNNFEWGDMKPARSIRCLDRGEG